MSKFNLQSVAKKVITKVVGVVAVFAILFSSVPAPAYAIIYQPGATLNPSCLPTDVNCSVSTPNTGGTLSAPSDVSVTPQGATGSAVYSYRVSIVDSSNGETVPSTATSTTAGNATLSATDYNAVSWSVVSGAVHYNIYGRTAGSELFIASTTATSYLDTGSTTPSGAAPTANTTGALSGNTLSITTDGTFGGALTVTGNTTLSNAFTLSALAGGILQTNASGTVSTTSLSALTTNALAWNGNTLTSTVNGVATTTLISDASISLAGLVSTSTQTFAGNKTFNGAMSLATTTVSNLLTANAGMSLASSTPLATGNTLYNNGGTLYWNGSQLKDTTAFSNGGNAFGALATLGTTDNNALRFVASSTEAMRILSSGNIGIGTTTPSTKLVVAGGFAVSTQVQTGKQTNPSLNSGNGTILGTAIGGTDTVIKYTTTGNTTFTPPTGVTNIRVLVVAGGGGGGRGVGGGGGGGGVIASSSVPVSGSVTVTVGTGGPGLAGDGAGTSGGNSVFSGITSTGGGAGAGWTAAAGNGGSGGGGNSGNAIFTAGGTGTTGQGSAGGTGGATLIDGMVGAGGGGAGAGGVNGGLATTNGVGGAGVSNDITGTPVFYGGGGGAGLYITGATTTARLGGNGGGGSGNGTTTASTVGTANTGGGGGGNQGSSSAAGGSGVVIVRFATVAGVATSSQALFKVTNAGTDTNSVLAFFETGASQSCIIAGQTGLSCSSDKNLKKDIEATEGVLGNVLALKPVTYNWRTAEELGADGFDPYAVAEGVIGDNVGFIAQDVEKIFPGLVRLDPNGNRTLAYDKFAPLIVAALQEQYGGMMGVNIASVAKIDPTLAELFASTTTLATLDDDGYEYTSVITNPIGYISERVDGGIKVVRILVAERMIAVEASFKRIFANELCLTDASGQLVCVTGENLKQIGGQTRALTPETASVSEQITPATTEATVAPTETAPAEEQVTDTTQAVVETSASSEVDLTISPQVDREPEIAPADTTTESSNQIEEVAPEETITASEPVIEAEPVVEAPILSEPVEQSFEEPATVSAPSSSEPIATSAPSSSEPMVESAPAIEVVTE